MKHEGRAGSGDGLGDADFSAVPLKQLVDATPDALLVVDGAGDIQLVNGQAQCLFGYDRQALLGQPLELLIPERQRVAHKAHTRTYFQAPSLRAMGTHLELAARHRDGRQIPVEVSLSPLQTRHGVWVCAAVRDVTERKQMQAEVQLHADRLANAVDSIEDALALFDDQGALLLCNSAYRALVGALIDGPLVGLGFREVLRGWVPALAFEGPGEAEAFCDGLLRDAQKEKSVAEVVTQGGQHLRLMHRRTVDGGFVQTVWDLTDDVKRETELRTAQAAAESASAAKSDFLSSMSHELRTPMNAILGFAQLLKRDRREPLSQRHGERVDHILKGGEHLLRLIDEVLDLSRIESGRISISAEPVSVGEVVDEVRAALEAAAEAAGVTLEMMPPAAGLPLVRADHTRLKQILMNLGSNGIKYGRKGGTVRFSVEGTGSMVRVRVQDDGIGIPKDKQRRIFQPFYRAGQESGSIEGTGIGLALSKRLAELMGGGVGMQSVEGQGSEFWFDLPAHKDAVVGVLPPPAGGQAQGARSILQEPGDRQYQVLYVEDNPSNVAFMADVLSHFPAVNLVTATSAEVGLELARTLHPDVIIMDINLPGISGLEATRRLKADPQTTSIPVIGLSAAATPRDVQRAHGVGFLHYLTKPVEVDRLLKVLDELLQG